MEQTSHLPTATFRDGTETAATTVPQRSAGRIRHVKLSKPPIDSEGFSRKLLQAHVSPREYVVAESIASRLGITLAEVVRRGIALQEKIEKLEEANVSFAPKGPNGSVSAATVLSLLK
jgi:hypothetical protein